MWNIKKVVTQEYEQKNIVAILKRNAKELKEMFISLIAIGDKYPALDYQNFIDFCISSKIVEDVT